MADTRFNILSLCAGVGMLDEGICLSVPGGRTVCYVERESGAAAILLARMADKALEPAPVWCGNLEDFDVEPWALALDCITAGFPCQPHSQAGARKSTEDERWIWPAIAQIIRRILSQRDAAWQARPFYLFLENVRGLLTSGDGAALGEVLADLALMGFDAEWGLLSAASVGASHQRERIFILAVADHQSGGGGQWQRSELSRGTEAEGASRSLDSSSERRRVDSGPRLHPAEAREQALGEPQPRGDAVAHAGCEPEQLQQRPHGAEPQGGGEPMAYADGSGRWEQGDGSHEGRPDSSGGQMDDTEELTRRARPCAQGYRRSEQHAGDANQQLAQPCSQGLAQPESRVLSGSGGGV